MVLTSMFQLRYLYDYQDSVIEHKWPTDSGLLSFYIMAAGDIYRELAADRIFDCGYISEKLRILNNINQMTVGDLREIRDTRIQYQDYPARLNEFKAKVEKFEQITASFDFGEYGYRRKAMLIALQVKKQLCDWGITGNNMKVEDIRKLLIILQKEINNLCEILASMLKQPTYQPFVREAIAPDKGEPKINWNLNIREGMIVYMPPEEYMERVNIFNRIGMQRVLEEERRAIGRGYRGIGYYPPLSESSYRSILEGIRAGNEIDIPNLVYRNGMLENEEGFHRALVARDIGIEKIPVQVIGEMPSVFIRALNIRRNDNLIEQVKAINGLKGKIMGGVPMIKEATTPVVMEKLYRIVYDVPRGIGGTIGAIGEEELVMQCRGLLERGYMIDAVYEINPSTGQKVKEINWWEVKENLLVKEGTAPPPDKQATRKQANNGFRANPVLINKQAAYTAYSGTSFEPEKRGEQAIRGFAEEVQAVYERLKPHARTDAEKALLIAEMERFQTSYAQKYNDLLYSHSRIVSTMIAGPSGFPVERMRKINEAYDKKAHETYEWKDRAEKAMLRALKGLATEEAGGEIAVLKNKIALAEKLQEMMVEANKIVRKKAEPGIGGVSKHQQLVNLGFTERQAVEALTPDYMGRIGFPSFALTNNSANIRRMKERLIELEKREVTPTAEIPFPGGYISDNREEDRVQIFFDQKPPQAMIDKLKSEGWRWAPSVGAWSRKRTDMAMNSARRITGAAAPSVQPPVMYVPPKYPPLLYPAPPQRPAEEIMFVPNPEKMTRDEYVKEKYKRMAQVLRQQGKNAIAERVEKGARDPERTFKYETSHRDQVVLALAQGKTVGGDVLKDYPDIVARIRQENEALLAKERAERERLLAIERAEENELNAELNRLPPSLKRHAETEIYGTLHMPETHKDYRNRYYIALGKVRRIAFTHLPQEPQIEVRKEEPVEPLSPEYEHIIKTYLEKRGHELTLQDFIWADKYTIRGTAKYPIRTMEEKRKREEFISKNYDEETGKKYHRGTVESALKRGIKVPEEVLKDYPDLIRREVPAPLPKIQSIQDVKQQVIQSIQDAKSMDELKQILKGMGFLPLPEPEKRQLMDLYQVRFSELMGELKFGERIPAEEEKKRRAPQKAPYAPPPRRLEEFGIKEAMRRGYGYA